MASDSGADDAAALRERVAQLEETVAEQQATSESPEEPTASRRGLLSAAAGVAGLGALGWYSSYPARAQAAGQVGTASNPIDVEAYDLTVQNQLADDLDGGGNSLTNATAVETQDLVGAKQVSEFSTIQNAIDAAGAGGTVVFDAAGAPHSVSGIQSWYDNQTVILHGKVELDSSTDTIFISSGGSALTGLTLVPNGNVIDGQSKTGEASEAVRFDDGSTECSIEGVLRVERMERMGVRFSDCSECVADTIVGSDIGTPDLNDSSGDVVNFGSSAQAVDCHVQRVVGIRPSRHTVTFGSKRPERCSVETISSFKPGGAHMTMESAADCEIGEIIGRSGRNAANLTNEASTYDSYPMVGILNSPAGGSEGNTIGRVIIKDSQGTGPDLSYNNACNYNVIEDFTSINSPGIGIFVGEGAGDAIGNEIGIRRIENAGDTGVKIPPTGPDTKLVGRGRGTIRECQLNAVLVKSTDVSIKSLFVEANGQDGSTTEAIFCDVDIDGLSVSECRARDGSSGAQSVAIDFDGSISGRGKRFIGNDFRRCTTAYGSGFALSADDAAVGNTPSP